MTQGCTRGRHSAERPDEPLRPEVSSGKSQVAPSDGEEIIYQGPKSAEALQKERPRCVCLCVRDSSAGELECVFSHKPLTHADVYSEVQMRSPLTFPQQTMTDNAARRPVCS